MKNVDNLQRLSNTEKYCLFNMYNHIYFKVYDNEQNKCVFVFSTWKIIKLHTF